MPQTSNPLQLYARHKYIVERFNYWTEIKRRRTDDTLLILQYKEVFMTERSIMAVIKNFKPNSAFEKQLKTILKPIK